MLDVRILINIETHRDVVIGLGYYAVIEVRGVDILPCVQFNVKLAAALWHQVKGCAVVLEILLDQDLVNLAAVGGEAYPDVLVLKVNDLLLSGECHIVKTLRLIQLLLRGKVCLAGGVGHPLGMQIGQGVGLVLCQSLYPRNGIGHKLGPFLFLKLFCIVPAEQQQHYADQRKSY